MRGHVRKRGPDTWAIVVYLGKDDIGKKRYVWQTVHGSKRDADLALSRILADGQQPAARTAKRTVAEQLLKWLTDIAAQRVAPATFYRYDEIVKKALPYRCDAARTLRPDAIQRAFRNWLSSGLSPQTVVHYHQY